MNWLLLKNSVLLSVLTTVLVVSYGFFAALCFIGLEKRWRAALLAFALMTLALPPFLVTNCWLGIWQDWMPFNLFSIDGAIWILSLMLWPIPFLLVSSAWGRLEPAQLEGDPAVTGWWLIQGVLWPLGRTSLTQGAVLAFVLALNNFSVPALLQVKVFPAEMWVRFNTTFDTIGALRLSWPLIAGPLLLLLWSRRREFPWPQFGGPLGARSFRRQLGPGWSAFCCAFALLLCLLSVGFPLFELVSVKRTWIELPGALAAGQLALTNSLRFAAAAATLCVLLALVSWRMPLGVVLWLPFLIPGVLLGVALILLFNHQWSAMLYQGGAIVVLAFVIRYLAVSWNTVAQGLRIMDRDLADDARLAGANRWQMLRHVHWPQIRTQVTAAWYLVFLLCLWDVESMILVVPPGGETLALRVFNLLHYGHNAQVNALCLILLVVALLPLFLWKVGAILRASGIQNYESLATNHGARAASKISLLIVLSILCGCGPPNPPNESPVQSRLFSRVQVVGSRGVGAGQLNKPRSVAVDREDNLYVADMTGRVQKFDPNGAFLLSWQLPQTDLGKPKGMCRDDKGNIVVLEPHYQRVNHFTTRGWLVAQWGNSGTNQGQFKLPRAVAVNSRGEILVSEYGAVERVQKFILGSIEGGEGHESNVSPRFLSSLGRAGTSPGEFNRPEGICVDSRDRLYVADSCNHRIQVFSDDGRFLRAYGKAGSGPGELSYPYDICVDSAGRQYVCEFGNSRVQIFDANDRPVEIIGGPGAEPGRFSNPWGVALDSAGNLYVADSQNHRVQKFVRL